MTTDRFTLDILREAFLAVADEMFISLQRTSQSPIVYEVLDFGVGLTNPTGELVSQGNGVAGFLGPLGDAVVATIEEVPNLVAGDVVVANDPYKGGGTHLSDVAMVRPIVVDGEVAPLGGRWGVCPLRRGQGPLDRRGWSRPGLVEFEHDVGLSRGTATAL